MMARTHKVTFGEMRSSGVRGLLIYCSDVRCSNWIRLSADACAPWPDDMRLSDLEKQFACKACGTKGADLRPDFDQDKPLFEGWCS